ncbi:hypothetical protein QR680_003254 [Steinernema hermaphroditum]|uniref:Protoheme IX farnesyltransferase, mitochondrial n=1 Tax=Steinernema hermaphroditum TaxID=289476 RepID=A0AA39H613_9BILA|nr:hypothetical protein QR680_003254 [Steinernema hermaphroditum]
MLALSGKVVIGSCRSCGAIPSAFFQKSYAAALPRTRPNPDEFVTPPVAEAAKSRGSKKLKDNGKKINLVVERMNIDEWAHMKPSGLVKDYLQLSKSRLTMLITTTAVGGYMMAPGAFSLSTFAACAVGTALMSSSANACNHLLESPYDAQMKRTQARVLVVHRFTPLHAFTFANATALGGMTLLWTACNPLTAALGLLNVGLYAGVYTPMKRHHIGCTWAGAVVGAIPPLMGYTAITGTLDPAAWNLRADYSRAGYRVMCVTNEDLCRRTTIRHSIALLGLCSIAAPLCDLTTSTFAWDSLPLNAAMVYLSYNLLYLPLIMILMVISNCGRNSSEKNHFTPSSVPGSLLPVYVDPIQLGDSVTLYACVFAEHLDHTFRCSAPMIHRSYLPENAEHRYCVRGVAFGNVMI